MNKLILTMTAAMMAAVSSAAAPKYVFLFIGDGMSVPQRMMADEFARANGRPEISFNRFPFQATTRTASANSLVTDSAAAATAIACGTKTANGRVGVDASGKVLESVAEVAKRAGKKVGIITSVTMNHATPAGFYAHRKNRGECYNIGLDLVASGFDYFGGGGIMRSNDKSAKNYDGDIYQLAEKAGYVCARTPEAVLALKPGVGKVIAGCTSDEIPYALDGLEKVLPLSVYVEKGIELLDNPAGFFMMCEGGSIDWCGHANDAGGDIGEVLELDKAVRVALAFAEKHPDETLIVVTGDHETGGMTMGFANTGYALYMGRIARQRCTAGRLKKLLNAAKKDAKAAGREFTFESAQPILTEWFGFRFDDKAREAADPMFVKPEELAALKQGFDADRLHEVARRLIAEKSGIGWTTGAHTALPVLTTATGSRAEIFGGFIENTDIANRLKALYR